MKRERDNRGWDRWIERGWDRWIERERLGLR